MADEGAAGRPVSEPVGAVGEQLRLLAIGAGFSVRELARTTGTPRSTVADALGGKRLPRLETVLAIVRACHGDEAAFRAAWTRAQLARSPSRPASAAPEPSAAVPPALPPTLPPTVTPALPSALPSAVLPAGPVRRSRRRRLVLVAVAGVLCVASVVAGFLIARSGDHASGPCRPARRYEVMAAGNLLTADRHVLVVTQPGDVFYATQLDASPYLSRHYGLLQRTRQWGYIDSSKLTRGRSDCLPG